MQKLIKLNRVITPKDESEHKHYLSMGYVPYVVNGAEPLEEAEQPKQKTKKADKAE